MRNRNRFWLSSYFWGRVGTYSLIFLLFWIMNYLTLYTSDDYAYRFIYESYLPSSNPIKVDGLWDIIRSQIAHWQLWNGRFVSHTIVQFFMQYDKWFFDLANSLVFLSLLVLVMKLATGGKRFASSLIVLLAFYFWWHLPEIGKSMLWLSGSGNYLWTSFIYMLYMYFYLNKKSWFLVPLGFFAGACNENSSPAVLLMCGLHFLYTLCFGRNWYWSRFLSLVSGACGFLLMMLSPGSQERGRLDLTTEFLHTQLVDISDYLLVKFGWIYFICLVLLLLISFYRLETRKRMGLVFLFGIGHLASAFALVLSPERPERTFFGSTIFLSVALIILLHNVWDKSLPILKRVLLAVMFLCFSLHYKDVVTNLVQSHGQVLEHYSILKAADKNSVVELPLLTPPYNLYSAYDGTANLSPDSAEWFNKWMAIYFDVAEIRGVERD